MNKAMCTSNSPHYATPKWLYAQLDSEFHFDDDPCPLTENGIDGLLREWGQRVYLNPPYGKNVDKWLDKAFAEAQGGKVVVCLIPARTDTRWWHKYCMRASEVRLVKGRLADEGQRPPFPSAIVIFRPGVNHPEWSTFLRKEAE